MSKEDKCTNCRHCDINGYCEIKEKTVNPNSTCPEFEEI